MCGNVNCKERGLEREETALLILPGSSRLVMLLSLLFKPPGIGSRLAELRSTRASGPGTLC